MDRVDRVKELKSYKVEINHAIVDRYLDFTRLNFPVIMGNLGGRVSRNRFVCCNYTPDEHVYLSKFTDEQAVIIKLTFGHDIRMHEFEHVGLAPWGVK